MVVRHGVQEAHLPLPGQHLLRVVLEVRHGDHLLIGLACTPGFLQKLGGSSEGPVRIESCSDRCCDESQGQDAFAVKQKLFWRGFAKPQ